MAKKKEEKIPLGNFVAGREFSQPFYREIFEELATKYKKESPRQHTVRTIIMLFKKKYPVEMRAFKRQTDQVRETRANKYASNDATDLQLILSFPESLFNRIDLAIIDPPFLQGETKQEELDWMIKNFPEFVVPEEI